MGMEEDTYSSIFQALKHPIRRRILRMLNDNPMTYTEILNELGIDNGLLNYHLENLQELLAKGEDEKYRLSEFGSAGLSVIERVETPKDSFPSKQLLKPNSLQSIVVILLLVTSTLLNGYFYIDSQNLRKEINTISDSYSKLQDNYTELQRINMEAEKKLEYYTLWLGEAEVADPRYMYQSDHADLSKYRAVATKLDYVLQSGKIEGLEDVLVNYYPDWANGSAYVALSSLNPEFTEPILDLFSIDVGENIRFLKAPAPPDTLETWKNRLLSLCVSELKNRGVNWITLGTYYDGRILLGVEEITPDTVDIIAGVVRESVPPGVIVIEERDPLVIDERVQDSETHLAGWFDEYRNTEEWDAYTVTFVASIRTHPGPHIWIPTRLKTNYTGLPDGVDVKVYPESYAFSGDSFRIVFENNRAEPLYWGSDWSAEKWVDGEWVMLDEAIVYTLDLRYSEPYSKVVNSFRFPFDEGLYRISKRCMLTDNYDTDKNEGVDEFTATFYLTKTQ